MLNIGPQELLLVLVVALLVVGPARLPELGRSIGKGLRELRKAQDEVRRTIQISLDDPPASTPARRKGKDKDAEIAPASTAAAAVSEAVAAAQEAEPPDAGADDTSGVTDVARTLGRSLAELRRAREEVQRTFRVDIDGRSMSGGPARAPRTVPSTPRTAPSTPPPDVPQTSDAAQDGPTGSPGETPAE